MNRGRLCALAAALMVIAGTSAFAQTGYIDAGVTMFVGSQTLVKSSTTTSYIGDGIVVCVGTCAYQLAGNHKIFHGTSMTAGIHFATSKWQYRGTLSSSASGGECYAGAVDDVSYKFFPPYGAPAVTMATLAYGQSEVACMPPSDNTTCPQGQSDCNPSPIVISLTGKYKMTSAENGVHFDIDADGIAERVSWTDAADGPGFLALDRNANGRIDNGAELFGDHTRLTNGAIAANGFDAIADLDWNGDGLVDAADPAWQSLVLWFDRNHDGVSGAGELVPVRETEIAAISTDYRPSHRKDEFGNEFRYRGEVVFSRVRRACFDVYLVTVAALKP
jgi:hypothetical protein